MADSNPASEPSYEELKFLRHLSRSVDDLLEESLKRRENLEQTFRRLFPELLALTGAAAVTLSTRNEELQPEVWHHGASVGVDPDAALGEHRWGARAAGEFTLVSQPLDVVGMEVGAMGLWFEGGGGAASQRWVRALDAIAEELDTVLASVQTAADKHQLIVELNHCLSNRVFEHGMDQAVRVLAERVKLPGFMLLYRDAVDGKRLHYRVYRYGNVEQKSDGPALPALEEAIRAHGVRLVNQDHHDLLRRALDAQRSFEAVLISGLAHKGALGKIVVWSPADGFSAFTMDLIRVLAATLAQRLIDYNRERTHLAQFFAAEVVDELLRDPDYERRHLTARAEDAGILFADINGFTRICEQVLEKPEKIGQFVDDWSAEAVKLLWKHGGVFDKMVGDCVIGLFGPPFFRTSRVERAEAAIRAALELQAFTKEQMNSHPEVARISERIQLPGLGVAIGVNVAPTYCGLFGPNQQYTGFSTGMNQTARLQSLGGFRETLVMENVRALLEQSQDAALRGLRYGPREETSVKNVAQPLRYHRVLDSGS